MGREVIVTDKHKVDVSKCCCGGYECPSCGQHADPYNSYCKNCLVGLKWEISNANDKRSS